jgi:hypothetical protein
VNPGTATLGIVVLAVIAVIITVAVAETDRGGPVAARLR